MFAKQKGASLKYYKSTYMGKYLLETVYFHIFKHGK